MMRRICLLMALFAFWMAKADTYVVSVGICNYADSRIPELHKTENDAKDIADLYRRGTKNVVLITGQYATRANILSTLRSQFEKAREGDKILFYFSGHGYPGGFCPYDMRSGASGLSYSDVLGIMKGSKASVKMIFADACFSGAIRGNGSSKQPQPGNVMFFLSSRDYEKSIESRKLDNGFFTRNLLKGLEGAADSNRDMSITARELFNFVSERTKSETSGRQHPVMWGNFPDDMVIVRYFKK